jgi:hypothetical protein
MKLTPPRHQRPRLQPGKPTATLFVQSSGHLAIGFERRRPAQIESCHDAMPTDFPCEGPPPKAFSTRANCDSVIYYGRVLSLGCKAFRSMRRIELWPLEYQKGQTFTSFDLNE